jgi:hypothetical protein
MDPADALSTVKASITCFIASYPGDPQTDSAPEDLLA